MIHAEDAEVLATYGSEFYQGRPAVTVNNYGQGKAYYIASRNEPRFLADFYGRVMKDLSLRKALGSVLPDGVTAQVRTDGERDFIFLLGFNRDRVTIDLGEAGYRDVLTGEQVKGSISLNSYSTRILEPI